MEIRPIDANALVASLQESYKEMRELVDSMKEDDSAKEVFQGELVTFLEAILRTKGMPTLDYEPVRHGEWDDKIVPFCNVCSVCKVFVDRGCFPTVRHKGCLVPNIGELKYCPNCGAKMDAKEE